MRIGFVSRRVLFARILGLGPFIDLRTADHDLPSHEIGPVQFIGGRLCGFQLFHFDKAETLGAVGATIHGNFHVLHGTDLGEEIEEIAFRGFVGQVAHIELGGDDFLQDRLGLGAFFAPGTIIPLFTFLEIGTRAAGAERLYLGLGLLAKPAEKLVDKAGLLLRSRSGAAVRMHPVFAMTAMTTMAAPAPSTATTTSAAAATAAISASASWAII